MSQPSALAEEGGTRVRRLMPAVLAVLALLLIFAAPVAADSLPESGTYKNLFSESSECVPEGPRTTCTQTRINAYSISPAEVVVCAFTSTYTYSDRTGRGRVVDDEGGCSDPIDASALHITVAHDQLTATLAPTVVTLLGCKERGCTAARTVVVSASDSGGPVNTYTSRDTFRDGTCTFRYRESGVTSPVSGTLTIDGVTMTQDGWAAQTDVSLEESCR